MGDHHDRDRELEPPVLVLAAILATAVLGAVLHLLN